MYKSLWRGFECYEPWEIYLNSIDLDGTIGLYEGLLRNFKYLESDWQIQRDRANQFELEAQQMDTENSNLHVENSKLQFQLDKAVSDYEYWRDKYLCEISNRQALGICGI